VTQRILILNLTRMGDLIQSTPLISGLRKKNPDAHISLVVSSDFEAFSHRIPHVNQRIVFNLRQFNDSVANKGVSWVHLYKYFENFLNNLRKDKYDLVINLSHSKLSALMVKYLGIKEFRGFMCNPEGDRITQHPWLQYFFIEPFNRLYNSFNLVDIFTRGGDVQPDQNGVQILLFDQDKDSVQHWEPELKKNDPSVVVGIQAGASIKGRCWPPGYFAKVADEMIEHMNAKIILFGVESETLVAEEIVQMMRRGDQVLNLTGQTSIPQLVGMLSQCEYLITNDTGTMHIAAALGVRIVGLFFAHAHPFETAPYAEGNIIFQARIPCAPCSYGVECNDIVCVRNVLPDHVLSVLLTHRETGKWEAPDTFSELTSFNLYETRFDDDQFLEVFPLIRQSIQAETFFLHAYRLLWKMILGPSNSCGSKGMVQKVKPNLLREFDVTEFENEMPSIERIVDKLGHVGKLAAKGSQVSVEIIRRAEIRQGNPSVLEPLIKSICGIDDEINLIGMTHPEIKPLTDIFNKRKENFYGEDVKELAQSTRDCYGMLINETQLLQDISEELLAIFSESPAGEGQIFSSSSSVEVPGR